MTHFLGSHLNRLDAKGRVSVPAAFRTALRSFGAATEGSVSMILRPSHKYPCVEAWPQAVFDKLAQQLDRYELFSPEYDNLAAAIYADAYPIESDREGRIILNEMLTSHAGVSDNVVFMGTGPIFQIWEPEAARARAAEARQIVNSSGLTLGGIARPAAVVAAGGV
ncbi:division/cell wall cluster transcriptional repressor MraZ [Acidisoma cellulosilytica]|uniref:Transcriptional regulator MraZ n=1 Tax=Acidisoma cellulosilyticum TaxID=2802395 RepID=A0A963YZ16_9PROT|nr:division/cell wall cluster transcriptional repressor MraZ [Acidisoma cellulosilyticum]MCB8878810.1 division/cell wall cluster transcriptional repressor MraZ [Acidisoma cellulosilyticum]